MLLFPHTVNNVNKLNKNFECRIQIIDLKKKKRILTVSSDRTIPNASAALTL